MVYLEGYLKTRSWETEGGEKRFRTEVVVHDMIMLDRREGGDEEDKAIIGAVEQDMDVIPEEENSENIF
ncbi:single-stranded DNA-binding protein [Candidatus Peregrinibacteria bacterium]|nr:single-stranded DNA-binding protein [Candidatus Peregrinibacteria bacterium]